MKKKMNKVYIVAYDNWWETESYYYRNLAKAEAKADELCNRLNINREWFLPLNCRQELSEWRIKFEEIKFDD